MAADVVHLPTVRIERRMDPRVALVEIFGGRVGEREIEVFLGELHKRGLRLAPIEGLSADE